MAASTSPSLILLAFTASLFLISPRAQAQPAAPAPSPPGPINLTGILDKSGQYTTFIRLLTQTQVASQITNQLNSSTEGMTVLAPTDNAFNNLKSGALNGLKSQDQVQVVLYHVLPKYYSLSDLQTVSNPVRTQASGQDGSWGLNFTSQSNQVNVSSGLAETQINNALRKDFPLAVYQVDKVLLPLELFGAKPPAAASTPAKSPAVGSSAPGNGTVKGPSSTPPDNGSGGRSAGLGLVVGVGLACMGLLS